MFIYRLVILLVLVAFFSGQRTIAQSGNDNSSGKSETDTSETWEEVKADTLYGTEVHNRPDIQWGYKLNLNGFLDLTKVAPSPELVRFGLLENQEGIVFLAHLYLNSIPKKFAGKTSAAMATDKYQQVVADTSAVLQSLKRGEFGPLSIVTYDMNEIWPLPDPDNPGQTIDSALVRRHCWGYFFNGGEWAGVHLSMPNYTVEDSTRFTDLLSTFEFVEKVPDSARPKINIIRPKLPPGMIPQKPK